MKYARIQHPQIVRVRRSPRLHRDELLQILLSGSHQDGNKDYHFFCQLGFQVIHLLPHYEHTVHKVHIVRDCHSSSLQKLTKKIQSFNRK